MTPYYDDGQVVLYLGDCREVDAWREAAVMVTDPPYGIDHGVNGRRLNGAKAIVTRTPVRSLEGDLDTGARDQALALWGDRPALVFGSWKAERPAGVKARLLWLKAGTTPCLGGTPWSPAGHPTPKPVGLMRQLLEHCPPGTVVDPFAGSGATLRAAKDLGRRAIGVELEERYCEIAANSLAQEVLPL